MICPEVSADAKYCSSSLNTAETTGLEWPDNLSMQGFQLLSRSKNNKEPSSDPETALAFVLMAVLSFDICSFLPFDPSLENTDSKWLCGVNPAQRNTLGTPEPSPPALNALWIASIFYYVLLSLKTLNIELIRCPSVFNKTLTCMEWLSRMYR